MSVLSNNGLIFHNCYNLCNPCHCSLPGSCPCPVRGCSGWWRWHRRDQHRSTEECLGETWWTSGEPYHEV